MQMWKSPPQKLHLTYECKLIYLCTFHIHCPLKVKFIIRDLRIMVMNIVSFVKAMASLQECMKFHLCLYWHLLSIPHHPHHPHLYSWLGEGVTFCKCVCTCSGNCWYGKVITAVCFKTSLLLSVFLYEMIVPGIFLVRTKYSEWWLQIENV